MWCCPALLSCLVALTKMIPQQKFYNHEVTRMRTNPTKEEDYKARKTLVSDSIVEKYISLHL